jgi:hypothetical protein
MSITELTRRAGQREHEDSTVHNANQKAKAIREFSELFDRFLSLGLSGIVGIRVPIQRNRAGNVRRLMEEET